MGYLSTLIRPIKNDVIAVVGASEYPGGAGFSIFKDLVEAGFGDHLYPVSVESGSIQGIQAYARLSDVPIPLDLAVIVVPSERVLSVIEEAKKNHVRRCVVITSEYGQEDESARVEAVLRNNVREHVIKGSFFVEREKCSA
jgi:acyl-CoA synthetase (NDP forming)